MVEATLAACRLAELAEYLPQESIMACLWHLLGAVCNPGGAIFNIDYLRVLYIVGSQCLLRIVWLAIPYITS